jgi:hypothetical protein
MIRIYGIIDNNGIFHDTSRTLRGAKCYATRHGYKSVGYRFGYTVIPKSYKYNGKWSQ